MTAAASAAAAKPAAATGAARRPGGQWQKRIERASAAWAMRFEEDQQRLAAAGPLEAALAHAMAESEKATVRAALRRALCNHVCVRGRLVVAEASGDDAAVDVLLASLTAGAGAPISPTGHSHDVVYVGSNVACVLTLLEHKCSLCKAEFRPGPFDVAAFPSSPSTEREDGATRGYTYYFATEVLRAYWELHDRGGLSAAAFAASHEAMLDRRSSLGATHLHPRGLRSGSTPGAANPSYFRVPDRQFIEAAYAFRRVEVATTQEEGMGVNCFVGSLASCPSCATTVEETSGRLDRSTKCAIVADASVTPSSNPNLARVAHATDLVSTVGLFFNPSSDPLVGAPLLSSSTQAGAGAAMASLAPAAGPTSAAAAGAARGVGREEGGTGRGSGHGVDPGIHHNPVRDHHNTLRCDDPNPELEACEGSHATGIVGSVCTCGFPLRRGFWSINRAERYAHYDRMFLKLVLRNEFDEIKAIYLDYGCLYRVHFINFFGTLPVHDTHLRADEIQFLVDWLHARGHKAFCRYSNGAYYIVNTGRRVGINMETLFSKVITRTCEAFVFTSETVLKRWNFSFDYLLPFLRSIYGYSGPRGPNLHFRAVVICL